MALGIMVSDHKQKELCLLRFSAWMGVFFAVLGVFWGFLANSGIILFDGIYSGVSIILSTLSLYAVKAMDGDDSAENLDSTSFHFGRRSLEPMVIALKSIVIIGVCVYGMGGAMHDILVREASLPVHSGYGITYSIIAIVSCAFSWRILKKQSEGLPDIVQAETEQWLIDTVFSVVVLIGFVISLVMKAAGWTAIVPYIDPGMVILASVYFIRVPIKRFVHSIRELLLMAPSEELRTEISRRIDKVRENWRWDDVVVRSAKIGRELTVDVVFVVKNGEQQVSIFGMDAVRRDINESLAPLGFEIWLNVVFTSNRDWA